MYQCRLCGIDLRGVFELSGALSRILVYELRSVAGLAGASYSDCRWLFLPSEWSKSFFSGLSATVSVESIHSFILDLIALDSGHPTINSADCNMRVI